jgi:hypothetical protein
MKLSLKIPTTNSSTPVEFVESNRLTRFEAEAQEDIYEAATGAITDPGEEYSFTEHLDAFDYQPGNPRESRASSEIFPDYTLYEDDTEQKYEPEENAQSVCESPISIADERLVSPGGSATDLARPKWPRRISSLYEPSNSTLPAKGPSPSIACSPTTPQRPNWPRRTSSLYPQTSSPYPDWCSWFDEKGAEIEEEVTVPHAHKPPHTNFRMQIPPATFPLEEVIFPKPVRSSRQIVQRSHQHHKSMFAQHESIELMSPAVLKQLYGVLGEALLQILQYQKSKSKHRRWSTGATLPRVSKPAAPPTTAVSEASTGARKRKGISMRFSMRREGTEVGDKEVKKRRGWLRRCLGIGAKGPPVSEVEPECRR